jgi:hypothetical protein
MHDVYYCPEHKGACAASPLCSPLRWMKATTSCTADSACCRDYSNKANSFQLQAQVPASMGCGQDSPRDWQFDSWFGNLKGMPGLPPEATGAPADKSFWSNTPLLESLLPTSGRCTADTLLGVGSDYNPAGLLGGEGQCAVPSASGYHPLACKP